MEGWVKPDGLVFHRLPSRMETTGVVAQVAGQEAVFFALNGLFEKFAVVPVGGDGAGNQAKNQAGNGCEASWHLPIQTGMVSSKPRRSILENNLHLQDANGCIFLGCHMDPDGVASERCGRVNGVILVGPVVVTIGGGKLERFPFTVVAYPTTIPWGI